MGIGIGTTDLKDLISRFNIEKTNINEGLSSTYLADFSVREVAVVFAASLGSETDGDEVLDKFNSQQPLNQAQKNYLSSLDHQVGVSFADVAVFLERYGIVNFELTEAEILKSFSVDEVVQAFAAAIDDGSSPSQILEKVVPHLRRSGGVCLPYIFMPGLRKVREATEDSSLSDQDKALLNLSWDILALEEKIDAHIEWMYLELEYLYPLLEAELIPEMREILDGFEQKTPWSEDTEKVYSYFMKDFSGNIHGLLTTELYFSMLRQQGKFDSSLFLVNQGSPAMSLAEFHQITDDLVSQGISLKTDPERFDLAFDLKQLSRAGFSEIKPAEGNHAIEERYVCFDYAYSVTGGLVEVDENGYPKTKPMEAPSLPMSGYEIINPSTTPLRKGDLLVYGYIDWYPDGVVPDSAKNPPLPGMPVWDEKGRASFNATHAAYLDNPERMLIDGMISKPGELPLQRHAVDHMTLKYGTIILVLRKNPQTTLKK